MNSYRSLALSAIVAAALAAPSTPQTLVTDLNTYPSPQNPDSNPSEFVRLDASTVLFVATDAQHGRELWTSDGTESGTALLADIEPGSVGSSPRDLVLFQGRVYFIAQTAAQGLELWSSDGTTAGTQIVADSTPGPDGLTQPLDGFRLVATTSALMFVELDDILGREVWVSDGTSAGTHVIVDINPIDGSTPRDLTPVGDLLFFTAIDGEEDAVPPGSGRELWVTDGTAAGTLRLTDQSGGNNVPAHLGTFGGQLFFQGYDDTNGREVWTSDGTLAGTQLFLDAYPGATGSWPRHFTAVGGNLYFDAVDDVAGREPWVSDGTVGGTHRIGDLHDASFPNGHDIDGFAPLSGQVVFRSGNYGLATNRLFVSDGTEAGTTLLYESFGVDVRDITSLGNRAVFSFNDVFGGQSPEYELWATDGTVAGTGPLLDPAPGTIDGGSLFADGTAAWFAAHDAVAGDEVWTTDGTPGATSLLADLNPATGANGVLGPPIAFEGRIYFAGDDGSTGEELYVSDGTAAGTTLFADINGGPGDSEPAALTVWKDSLVFRARDQAHGSELWITNGTPQDVRLFVDTIPGPASGVLNDHITPFGNHLLYESGFDLWITDGTEPGTMQLADLYSDPPLVAGDVAYFAGFSGNGAELWVTDGTMPGTQQVVDIAPGILSSYPKEFARVDGGIVFQADESSTGAELWFSDGTAEGTVLILDAFPGSFDSWPETVEYGSRALVQTSGNGATERLWITDGTAVGTELLWEPSVGTGAVQRPVVAGDVAYFWAFDDATGNELWKTDGTVPGTVQVSSFVAASITPSDAREMIPVGSGREIVFRADLPATGDEVWLSDGTLAGTVPQTEIAPGQLDAIPRWFARSQDNIYFSANDGALGSELYSLSFASTGGHVAEPFGVSCPSTAGLAPRIGASGAPLLGGSFDVELSDGPPTALAALFFSLDVWFLDVVPECQFYLGAPFYFAAAGATSLDGDLSLTLPVPNKPGLVALPIFFQYLIDDPGHPFGGLGLSDGLEVLIGP